MYVAVGALFQASQLGHQGVEFLALVRECPVQRHLRLRLRVLAFAPSELAALPLGQEGAHLLGFQETGQTQVVEFVL